MTQAEESKTRKQGPWPPKGMRALGAAVSFLKNCGVTQPARCSELMALCCKDEEYTQLPMKSLTEPESPEDLLRA